MPITVEGIQASIGGRRILRGVSLSAGMGEIHVILGPNGSGKTTLVKVIAGLIQPEKGRVVIDGIDSTSLPPERRGLGVVFQGTPLLPLHRVIDHIVFPLRMRGIPWGEALARARETAELLGITGLLHRKLEGLSGGERQKVAIATALATGARNLVLDEPFSSLDPSSRIDLYRILYRLRDLGYTILLTTHIVDDVVFLADKIWILVEGSIAESGTPQELVTRPGVEYTRTALRVPFTGVVRCPDPVGICEILGKREPGGTASIPYYMVRAVPGGSHRLLTVIPFNGDRIAVVDVGAGILYAKLQTPSDDAVDRVDLVVVYGHTH